MKNYKFCPICASKLLHKQEDDFDRLFCSNQACSFVFYDNPTPVVAAIVLYQGEVILARNPNWPPKWFGLITGFLEKNEAPEAGVLREVKEELNLDGEVKELVGLFPFRRKNQLLIVYEVQAEGKIKLNEELESYKKVAPEKLRAWKFGTGKAVQVWLEKQGIFNPVLDL